MEEKKCPVKLTMTMTTMMTTMTSMMPLAYFPNHPMGSHCPQPPMINQTTTWTRGQKRRQQSGKSSKRQFKQTMQNQDGKIRLMPDEYDLKKRQDELEEVRDVSLKRKDNLDMKMKDAGFRDAQIIRSNPDLEDF